eukprot:6214348-Pleurochrysis_carterae.AAC.2
MSPPYQPLQTFTNLSSGGNGQQYGIPDQHRGHTPQEADNLKQNHNMTHIGSYPYAVHILRFERKIGCMMMNKDERKTMYVAAGNGNRRLCIKCLP